MRVKSESSFESQKVRTRCTRSTRYVGQDPWNDNLSEFERHLSELSKDSMYKALMANQKAQELDPEITVHEK